MKVLVANLGSTSFKYRLYDLGELAEPLLARGSIDRIGSDSSKITYRSDVADSEQTRPVPDHAEALRIGLEQLSAPGSGVISDPSEVAAIGFKAVHARGISGVHRIDESVIDAMEAYNEVAPAHNPPYVKAMRALAAKFPAIPLVAAFETGYHATIPEARRRYAVPDAWAADHGIRRWGFHGASHRYIGERMAVLLNKTDAKIISCHLGGSSSLCAIDGGRSVATSMGMSPQSGLPQNNRVGDFDAFALPALIRETGQSLEQLLKTLTTDSGLAGLGDAGNDLRDIEGAAESGHPGARLAIDVYVESIRDYLGAYLVALGGADAIAFTAGIGENSPGIRASVLRDLSWFGIELDPDRNTEARGVEARISAPEARVEVWTVPTNEEIVVARQARDHLNAHSCQGL